MFIPTASAIIQSYAKYSHYSVGSIPAVEEEEFGFQNTTEPDILHINVSTGMVSLRSGETLAEVNSINFTVVITRTDNETCKLYINFNFRATLCFVSSKLLVQFTS